MKAAASSKPRVWQPPGWSPQGAVDFLHGLVAEDAGRLAAWALGKPDETWATWLRGQGLAPYVWHRLKAAGCTNEAPPGRVQTLRGAYYAAVADAELHTAELVAVLATLRAARVTPVVFKGAALAYLAYPDPACRPMGDLDLWVTAESMQTAQAALEAVGYRQHVKDTRPVEFQAKNGGEVQLGGAGGGRGLVELHYSTFAGEWLRRTTALDKDCIACRTVPVTVAGCSAWALSAEDAVLQLAVHLAVNHQMSYPGLRGLVDIVLQARSQPPDWRVVAERAHTWRVATATWLVLSLAHTLLGLPGAEESMAALRPSAFRRRLLTRFANTETMLAGRDITHGPLRFIFLLLLIDRPGDALRLLGRALWPEGGWLAARYGASGPRVRMRHLAGALRGRV